MVGALVRRHRADNGFHLLQTTLIDRGQLGGLESRDHRQDIFERAHLFNLLQLGAKVLQGEAGLAHFLFERCRSFLINGLLSFLDQGQHVPHAQEPRGHTVGMKGLERLDLLPYPDKLHWLPDHGFDRQGCTTTRIPIELGQDRAINGHGFVKGLGYVDGFLARHGIDHEKGIMWRRSLFDLPQLLHELLVDLQTASRIEDNGVTVARTSIVKGLPANFDRVSGALLDQDRGTYALAQHAQLLHGRGAIHVRRYEERMMTHLLDFFGQLGRGGGFPSAVQTHQEYDRWWSRSHGQGTMRISHQRRQLVTHDFDHLLPWG